MTIERHGIAQRRLVVRIAEIGRAEDVRAWRQQRRQQRDRRRIAGPQRQGRKQRGPDAEFDIAGGRGAARCRRHVHLQTNDAAEHRFRVAGRETRLAWSANRERIANRVRGTEIVGDSQAHRPVAVDRVSRRDRLRCHRRRIVKASVVVEIPFVANDSSAGIRGR